jgi:hypothetical protein
MLILDKLSLKTTLTGKMAPGGDPSPNLSVKMNFEFLNERACWDSFKKLSES